MRQVVKILIVDDHPSVRHAVANYLKSKDRVEVVGEAADGAEAITAAAALRPDVILMDYSMPGMNGDEATRAILNKLDTAVIGLSTDDRAPIRQAMQSAGARGFFSKCGNPASLLSMIYEAADCESGNGVT